MGGHQLGPPQEWRHRRHGSGGIGDTGVAAWETQVAMGDKLDAIGGTATVPIFSDKKAARSGKTAGGILLT